MDLRFGLEHDVWHELQTPGAYEWWYFDAIAGDGEYALVAIFCLGLPFSPHYREAVRAHRAGARPVPDPRDYALLSFTLYRRGRWDAYLLNEYPASHCETATDRPLIRIAGSRAECGVTTDRRRRASVADGTMISGTPPETGTPHSALHTPHPDGPHSGVFRLHIADTLLGGGGIEGDLRFHPLYIPRSDRFDTGGGAHTWVLAAPACQVAGEFHIRRPDGERTVPFRGMGYHDHNYGTEDFTAAMRAWSWGRFHLPDATLVYYDVAPLAGRAPTRRLVYLENRTGAVTPLEGRLEGRGWHANPFLLASPSAIRFQGEDGDLRVEGVAQPETVVDPGPFYLRFLSRFDVCLGTGGAAQRHRGLGFAEYLQPARLDWRWTWPLLKTRFIRSSG